MEYSDEYEIFFRKSMLASADFINNSGKESEGGTNE